MTSRKPFEQFDGEDQLIRARDRHDDTLEAEDHKWRTIAPLTGGPQVQPDPTPLPLPARRGHRAAQAFRGQELAAQTRLHPRSGQVDVLPLKPPINDDRAGADFPDAA